MWVTGWRLSTSFAFLFHVNSLSISSTNTNTQTHSRLQKHLKKSCEWTKTQIYCTYIVNIIHVDSPSMCTPFPFLQHGGRRGTDKAFEISHFLHLNLNFRRACSQERQHLRNRLNVIRYQKPQGSLQIAKGWIQEKLSSFSTWRRW